MLAMLPLVMLPNAPGLHYRFPQIISSAAPGVPFANPSPRYSKSFKWGGVWGRSDQELHHGSKRTEPTNSDIHCI
jgi:hypothetical protein